MDKVLTETELDHLRQDIHKDGQGSEGLENTAILRSRAESLIESAHAMQSAINTVVTLQGKLEIIRTAWAEVRQAGLSKGLTLGVMIIDQALDYDKL